MSFSRPVAVAAVVALLGPACGTSQTAADPPPLGTRAAPMNEPPHPEASEMPRPPQGATRARVVRVVDGDTIVLSGIELGEPDRRMGGRRARLIGIDTPEVHGGVECLGRESSAFTERQLNGADVLVDFDVDPIDRYGRALVYVWSADATFFNGRIVAEGFALPLTVPPNVRYADLFFRLAVQARTAGRGLWAKC